MLLLTLAVAPFVGRTDDDARIAAGGQVVGASTGEPIELRELMAQTTSTFLAATTVVSTTTTTETTAAAVDEVELAAPTTSEATTTTTTTIAPATTTTVPPASSTTAAPTTTTTAAPATTAPPTTTTTTAPPRTTTTTAPETAESSGGDEQYAYDDPRSTQVWYDLADCEAGGDWYIDTGNGYYGGLQFSLGSWEAVGGSGYPNEHPPSTQIEMGRRLQARQGWDAWPHCAEKLGLT